MSQASRASTQGSETHSLKNRVSELAYKIFARNVAERILSLVEFGYFVVPYRGPKQPALRKYRELLDAEPTWENLAKAWERATVNNTSYYGVLLGRPSQHLILIDIDDERATELLEAGREDEARQIVQDLFGKVREIVPPVTEPALGLTVRPALFTRTRRGVHILLHLRPEDYAKLEAVLGKSNIELGETVFKGHNVKVELRLRGATPLKTEWHETDYDMLPLLPVSLQYLEKLLQTLGVRPPALSAQERSSAAGPQEGNSDVQNTIKSDEETHTPVTSSIQDTSARETGARRLSEAEVSKIVQTLAPYWIQGHRDHLELALLGWLWKAGVDYQSVERVIARIVEETGDEERDKRFAELRRQWKLFESGEKREHEILGRSGIEAELESILAEKYPELSPEERRQKVFQMLYELEQVLGRRRTKNIRARIKPGLYVDNDVTQGIRLIRITRDRDGSEKVSWEVVLTWYIDKVRMAWGQTSILYSITLKHPHTGRTRTYTGTLAEIARRIMAELPGLGPVRKEVLHSAISMLVNEFDKRKLLREEVGSDAPALVPDKDGKLRLVRDAVLGRLEVPEQLDIEKAQEALRLLVEFSKFYDEYKFSVIMSFAGYAVLAYPLNIIYGPRKYWLALLGTPGTGKSGLAKHVVFEMIKTVDPNGNPVIGNLSTYYRLVKALDTTGFIALWDEAERPSETLAQMIKRSTTMSDTPAHERGDINRQYYGRGVLILTSNDLDILYEKALMDRFIVVLFGYEDLPEHRYGERAEEMKQEYLKTLFKFRRLAPHLGRILIEAAIRVWEKLGDNAYLAVTKHGALEIGRRVWMEVAEMLRAEVPWARKPVEYREPELTADVKDMFYDWLGQRIRQVIAEVNKTERPVGDIWEILVGLYDRKQLMHRLPWLHIDGQKMVLTAGVLSELKKVLPAQHQYALTSTRRLAEVLGLKYYNPKVKGKTVRGIVIPREVFERHVLTGEDYLIRYEKELERLIETGRLEASVDAVVEYLVNTKGLDRDTAEEIAREFAGTHTYLFRTRARKAEEMSTT